MKCSTIVLIGVQLTLFSYFAYAKVCYEVSKNFHLRGLTSTRDEKVTECEEACTKNKNCHAFEIHENTKDKCWIQTKPYSFTKKDFKPVQDVNIYMSKPCGNPKVDQTSNQKKEMNVENSLLEKKKEKVCYAVSKNHQVKGLSHTKSQNVAECMKACSENKHCHVFDFNEHGRRKCWIQIKPHSFTKKDLKVKTHVNNYMEKPCQNAKVDQTSNQKKEMNVENSLLEKKKDNTCWVSSPNKHINGLSWVNTESLHACAQWCYDTEDCGVIDFNPTSSYKCFIQTKEMKSDESLLVNKEGVTHYILKDFCKNKVCWQEKPQTQYMGLAEYYTDSLQSCREKCLNTPVCMLFNFVPNSPYNCYIQNKEKILEENFKSNSAVNTYILRASCKEQFCWTKHVNYHYNKLVKEIPAKTLEKCKLACNLHVKCNVIQFIKKTKTCRMDKTGESKKFVARNSHPYHILRNSCKVPKEAL